MAYTLSNKCAKNLSKWTVLLQLIIKNVVTCFFGTQCRYWAGLTLYGYIKTAEHRTIIEQYGDWYTGRWWVGCYIWYSEEGPGRAAAPPSLLLAVPNVTAHPSTASVWTSYYSMWHNNCLCILEGIFDVFNCPSPFTVPVQRCLLFRTLKSFSLLTCLLTFLSLVAVYDCGERCWVFIDYRCGRRCRSSTRKWRRSCTEPSVTWCWPSSRWRQRGPSTAEHCCGWGTPQNTSTQTLRNDYTSSAWYTSCHRVQTPAVLTIA